MVLILVSNGPIHFFPNCNVLFPATDQFPVDAHLYILSLSDLELYKIGNIGIYHKYFYSENKGYVESFTLRGQ